MFRPPPNVLSVTELTAVMPMLDSPPAVPLVVNTVPVLKLGSLNVILKPVPIVAFDAAAVVAVSIVAVVPSAETAVMAVPATMPPPLGPATFAPTSPGTNVPAAAVSVVAPLAHDTPVIWRPAVGTAGKVCV